MVYAGKVGRRSLTLGVSGRLMKRNLVMWDPETNSLWSQMQGKGIYGPLKGKVLTLEPAVFVGLDTWRHMHKQTLVLDLSPVHERSWYYTTRNLEQARDAQGAALGIGLRQGKHALVVGLKRLQKEGVEKLELGQQSLLLVWLKKEKAALVYQTPAGGRDWRFSLSGGKLLAHGSTPQGWDALTGAQKTGEGLPLKRYPYIPTIIRAWKSYYPTGRALL